VAAVAVATTTDHRAAERPRGTGDYRAVALYDFPSMSGRRTILMVEDEPSITEPLAAALSREGWDSRVAATAAEGIELAEQVRPELVLLDVMLPDGSGYDVCRELRRRSDVPIIMLTARGEETDRIVGLEVGADDYVVKPFSARELIARVRAVLRRTAREPQAGDDAIAIGDVRLDSARHEVSLGGEPVDLTRKEFEVLQLLMRNAGAVVSRDKLIEEVWDMNWFGPTKTLDVHVSGLRKKLGDDPSAPRYLHTVRGVGFRFASADELDGAQPA
jgi:two-component system response regulator RegX3